MEKKIFNFFQAIDQYSKVVISRINKGQIVNAKAEITTLYEFIFSYFNKLYSDDKFLEKIVINSEELKFIHGETSITKNIHEFDLSFKRAELCLFSVKYFNDVTNKILKDAVKAESNILELLILELNNDLIRVIESEKKSSEREISALLYRNLEIINQSKSENVIYYTIPCYKWYISIVFYEDFNLNFLRSFDEYFFKAFQIIISKNNEIIWLQFIRDISNNFNIWRIYNKSLWRDYINVFNPESYELEKEILLLENKLMTEISTRVEFSKVSEKILFVVEFIKKSYPHISDEQIENIKADFYQLYYKGLKKFNFQMLLVKIASFALLKNKYTLINNLINYSRPSDMDAWWGNPDVANFSLAEILSVLLRKDEAERSLFHLWEDRHGFKPYFSQFLAILLIRNYGEIKTQFFHFNVKEFLDTGISNLKVQSDNLIEEIKYLKKDINDLLEDKTLLEAIGIKVNFEAADFNHYIDGFIYIVQNEVEQELQGMPLDDKKIEDYINKIKSGLQDNFQLLKLFKLKGKLAKKEIKSLQEFKPIIINRYQIIERSYFIEDYDYVSTNYGQAFGRWLGLSSDYEVFRSLGEKCLKQEILVEGVKKFIENLSHEDQEYIFVSCNFNLDEIFGNDRDFKRDIKSPKFRDIGFTGRYKNYLDVFNVFIEYPKTVLLIEKSKLPNFNFFVKQNPDLNLNTDFYLNVVDLSKVDFRPDLLVNTVPNIEDYLSDTKISKVIIDFSEIIYLDYSSNLIGHQLLIQDLNTYTP